MTRRLGTAVCAVDAHRRVRLGWLGLLCCALTVHAAGPPLSATFQAQGPGRSGAPRRASVTLLWNGTSLLEGDLLVEIMDGRAVLSRSTIGGVALAPGEQTLEMLLPPASTYGDGGSARARLTFITQSQKIDLDTHPCSVPGLNERVLSVLYPVPVVGDSEVRKIAASLRLDWLNPEAEAINRDTLRSGLCPLSPDAWPSTPEEYCACDLVVLTGAGVAKLRAAQLNALLTWIRAGGGLCVINPQSLPEGHERFIMRLFGGAGAGEEPIVFGPDGRLLGPRLTLRREALGRAALLIDADLDTDGLRDDRDWRHMLAFAWKVRASQERAIVDNGAWNADAEDLTTACGDPSSQQMQHVMRQYQQRLSLKPIDCLSASNYLSVLMPRDMSFVRLGPLTVVLGLLVFCVGPFDYFVLKRFRLQRFTWMTVPIYVVVATVAIMTLANRAMGRYDRHERLCVLDTDTAGIPVRQNDFHLVIPSHHGELREQVKHALVAPVSVGVDFNAMPVGEDQPVGRHLTGRYPYDFDMSTRVSQWRPIAWRAMSLRPSASFPWQLPQGCDLWSTAGVDDFWKRFQDLNSSLPQGAYLLLGGGMRELRNQTWAEPVGIGDQRPSRLVVLTEGPRIGYFSIVSSVSPACDPFLEDVPVYDISDAQQAVLVLVWREKDQLFMSRTSYWQDAVARAPGEENGSEEG